jgi:hypothetical protein
MLLLLIVCCPSAGDAMQESCPAYSIEVVHCVLSARETGVIDARRRVEKRRGEKGTSATDPAR